MVHCAQASNAKLEGSAHAAPEGLHGDSAVGCPDLRHPLQRRHPRLRPTNLFQPQEVAYYIPQIPEGADANGINDVHVDENGIMYVVDRLQGGLYILEMNV